MGDEITVPESSSRGEIAALVVDLKDGLESSRVARRRLLWFSLVPGPAAIAYFVWTAFVAASPVPSMTLALVFGGAFGLSWKRYSRLISEELEMKEEIRGLEERAIGLG